jgi:hypothetical protein
VNTEAWTVAEAKARLSEVIDKQGQMARRSSFETDRRQ